MNPINHSLSNKDKSEISPALLEVFSNERLIKSFKSEPSASLKFLDDVYEFKCLEVVKSEIPEGLKRSFKEVLFAIFLSNQGLTHLETRGLLNKSIDCITDYIEGYKVDPNHYESVQGKACFGAVYASLFETIKKIIEL